MTVKTRPRASLTAALTAAFAVASLTSCGSAQPASDGTSRPAGDTSVATTPPPEPDTTDRTPIRIEIGDRAVAATLWDTPASRSLLDQLPLTLEFSVYDDQELTAQPPRPLDMEGMPEGDAPQAGDVGYYAPTGVLALHFADIGYFTGSARLGRIDGDLSALRGLSGTVPVTIRAAR